MAGEYDITNVNNMFKIKYGPLSENVYNSANVLLGRAKKTYDFTGRQMFVPIPTSFGGGVGSGSLPAANYSAVEDAIITAKKVYSVISIDREAMKASSNDEGAFVRFTKWPVQKGVESWMRNASRILFGDGSSELAAGDAATNVLGTGTAIDPYIVVLASTTKEANIEEKDFWNYDAETTTLEVISYVPSTKTVTLVGTSAGLAALTGVGPMLATKFFYMQGSKDNDPLGLKGVCDATSGTLYTVPVTRRWQSYQEAAGGAGLSTDLMNKVMLEVQRKSGKVPNMIMCSYTQYRKLLNLLEDQKRYDLAPRAANLKGKVSFKGVEFMSSAGPVGVFAERFCEDDRMYFLNDNFIKCCHRPGFGWFDDDGTVLLRDANSDSYSARYGGYFQNYIVPTFQGVISGLAI